MEDLGPNKHIWNPEISPEEIDQTKFELGLAKAIQRGGFAVDDMNNPENIKRAGGLAALDEQINKNNTVHGEFQSFEDLFPEYKTLPFLNNEDKQALIKIGFRMNELESLVAKDEVVQEDMDKEIAALEEEQGEIIRKAMLRSSQHN